MKKVPKQIAIEVSNRCQLKCSGCFHEIGYERQPDMDIDFVKSIIDRNTFDATIIPYLWNEPTLYPHIFDMIEHVVRKKQRAYITTNGMIFHNDLFELITEKNRVYQIIFSLDGLPGSKSIELCRKGSDEKVILENIRKFVELKERKGNNIDLCLKICQRGQDWEEIEEFIYLWLSRGIDYICVGRMLNQSGLPLRRYPCQYFNDMYMLIRVDREIIPCMYNYDVAIKNYFNIGKLDKTEDLIEAYNRIDLVRYRDEQKKGLFRGPCKTCNSAYTGRGLRGVFEFNDPEKKRLGKLYSTMDYYNCTYSLKDKAVGIQYDNI
jgi:MoaA/NifB/PqqE/SkfB family radical SAM enzyme